MVPIVAATLGRRPWATERTTAATLTAAATFSDECSPCHDTKRADCRQCAGPFIVLSWLAAGHEATGEVVGATVLAGDSSPPMSRRNGGYVSVISDE